MYVCKYIYVSLYNKLAQVVNPNEPITGRRLSEKLFFFDFFFDFFLSSDALLFRVLPVDFYEKIPVVIYTFFVFLKRMWATWHTQVMLVTHRNAMNECVSVAAAFFCNQNLSDTPGVYVYSCVCMCAR